GCTDKKSAARIASREVAGPQQTRLVRYVVQDFLAVPAVIAARQNIDSRTQKLVGNAWRDAEPRGGILPVSYHQVDFPLRHEVSPPVLHNLPAGRADNVTDEKDTHGGLSSRERKKQTERTAWPWGTRP